MKIADLALLVLVLWTLLGIMGTGIALRRREPARARRGILTIAVVWSLYLTTLLVTSRLQPSRVIAPGQDRCFDDMCFAIVEADDLEGFRGRNNTPEHLLRVHVRVSNQGRGRPQAESALAARLLDSEGRRWAEVPGLSGVPLTVRLPAGASTESSPVFRLPSRGTPVGLILSHRFSPARLVIGDAESLGHQPDILLLPAARPVPPLSSLAVPPLVSAAGRRP